MLASQIVYEADIVLFALFKQHASRVWSLIEGDIVDSVDSFVVSRDDVSANPGICYFALIIVTSPLVHLLY